MDDDGYVPQISQMDYSLLDGAPYFEHSGMDLAMGGTFQPPMEQAYSGNSQQFASSGPAQYHMPRTGNYAGGSGMPADVPKQRGKQNAGAKSATTNAGKQKGQKKGKKEKEVAGGGPSLDSRPQFTPAQQPLPASFSRPLPPAAQPPTSCVVQQPSLRQVAMSSQPYPSNAFPMQQQPWSYAGRGIEAQRPTPSGYAEGMQQRATFPPMEAGVGGVGPPQQQSVQVPPYSQQPVRQAYYSSEGPATGGGVQVVGSSMCPQPQQGQHSYPAQPTFPGQANCEGGPTLYYQPSSQQPYLPAAQAAGYMRECQPQNARSYPPTGPPTAMYLSTPGTLQQSVCPQQTSAGPSWVGDPSKASAISPAGGHSMQGMHPAQQYPTQAMQNVQAQLHFEVLNAERELSYLSQQPQKNPEAIQACVNRINYYKPRLQQLLQQQAMVVVPQQQPHYPSPAIQQHHQEVGAKQRGMVHSGYPVVSAAMATPMQQGGPSHALRPAQQQQTLGSPSHTSQYYPLANHARPPLASAQHQQAVHSTGADNLTAKGGGVGGKPVAVMQTAPNQVQVNITPEVAGQTFISVYHHQTQPSSTSGGGYGGMPSGPCSPSPQPLPKGDSVPPEPMPPKVQEEPCQTRVSRANKTSATPSQMANTPTSTVSSMAYNPPPPPPPANTSTAVSIHLKAPHLEQATSFTSFATCTIPVRSSAAETLTVQASSSTALLASTHTDAPAEAPQVCSIQEEVVERKGSIEVSAPKPMASIADQETTEGLAKCDAESADMAMPAELSESAQTNGGDHVAGVLGTAPSPHTHLLEPKQSTPNIEVASAEPEVGGDNSTDKADSGADKKMRENEEEERKNQAKKRGRPNRKSTASGSAKRKKSGDWDAYAHDKDDEDFVLNKKRGGRKRKAVERDDSKDEESVAVSKEPDEEADLEQFVEKRRSGRKRTEKKSYDEDKTMEFEEELPIEHAQPTESSSGPDLAEAEAPKEEWIVEKVLAIRIAKRKKNKCTGIKEEGQPASGATAEDSIASTTEKHLAERDAAEDQEKIGGDAGGREEKALVTAEGEGDIEDGTMRGEPADVAQEQEDAKPEEPVPAVATPAEDSHEEGSAGQSEVMERKETEKVEEPKPEGMMEQDGGKEEGEVEEVEEEEVYVKFKAWKFVDELEALDKRVVGKINRFKQKNNHDVTLYDDEEYFNDDYTIVDRVLDETYDESDSEYYALVKWRSLGYDECTWELFKDVPKDKIEECRRRNNLVDSCKVKERSRPRPDEWEQAKIPLDKAYKDGNQLRDYQVEGVNWLVFGYLNSQNCILADEMGLGKTVQTITFLQAIYDLGLHGPFLVVVPLSTLHNWEREFETWTDMNVVVYHGNVASRKMLQDYEFFYGAKQQQAQRSEQNRKRGPITKFDVVITTFETVVSDCEVLRRISYQVCVIDEAHRLKNRNCKLLTNGLIQFQLHHKVLLTGTPLQNSIHELFSLLNFLEPEQFHNSVAFLEQFGQCQTEEQVQKLQEILKPMMLRRLKEDVEKNIPLKEETIIEVQLSNIQKKYYRAILERNFTHLLKGTSVPSLMNTMMELRKCCNHPFLIRGAEEQIVTEVRGTLPPEGEEDVQLHALVQSSGKMVLIDKLLPKLRQDGHKVLIFSQMVRVLDILEEFLNHMSYPYERIDGNIRGDMRQAAIDRFGKQEAERFVFLLCTRAGGLGINLTAADTVIIFDSDWNPQNDIQAQARCHRIGQTKMVKVYRLITSQTYEREMFDRASMKLGLDRAVLQSSTARGEANQQLSRKEVEDLLKKGAYGAIMDEDNEGSKFSEEDIETILQRRTQTIILEPGIKGSTFAKASFKSSDNREDIDILDPNFWQKWAKKANIDVEKASGASGSNSQHLIVSEPRSRRRRFEERNYKPTESGDDAEGSEEEGRRGRPLNPAEPGPSRAGRGVKKRRRGAGTGGAAEDDDEDYVHYRPDELAFNKSEYFKVEKLLGIWGFGRWATLKEKAENLSLSEEELEHISRTLLLHCLRESRGDERTRDFVWQLITPKGGVASKAKKGVVPSSIYHEGWASLPEYNPPAFALDSSFQRHIHRHSNRLMLRVQSIEQLRQLVIGEKESETMNPEVSHNEIQLQLPSVSDPPHQDWDSTCDKCLLLGIYRHGLDNFESIRSDSKLCFAEKGFDKETPSVAELNSRFKRLMTALQKQAEAAAAATTRVAAKHTRWTKAEEQDFIRLLRSYGVRDSNDNKLIDWSRFRELSTSLKKKSDEAMLEQLYCILAMCTYQQGGELSAADKRRAASVEQMSARRAEKLMNRLHLMRKIHAIITAGIENVQTTLKLCSTDVMPDGWTDAHDEALLIVVDKFGLDDLLAKITSTLKFENLRDNLCENDLLRRVIEICTTLDSGKWNGRGSTETMEDVEDDSKSISALQKAAIVAAAAMAESGGSSGRSTPRGAGNKRGPRRKLKEAVVRDEQKGGRKQLPASANSSAVRVTGQQEREQTKAALQSAATAAQKADLSGANVNYVLSLLGMAPPSSSSSSTMLAGSGSASASNSLQQQMQQLQALMAISSMFGTSASSLPASTITSALNGLMACPESTPAASSSKGSTSETKGRGGDGNDILNLCKKEASAESASTSKSAQRASSSSTTASLSTGLSSSAIERLNQLSTAELLSLSDLPPWTHVPVLHAETGARICGDKAPRLKDLDKWLSNHPQHSIDIQALLSQSGYSRSDAKPTTERQTPMPQAGKRSTPSRVAKEEKDGGDALEPGEVPAKRVSQASKASTTGLAAQQSSLAQLENSVVIGVFDRSTGVSLPSDKWPTVRTLLDWLDTNPTCNIQSAYANIKTLLPKLYHSRVGGDSSTQALASAATHPELFSFPDSPDLFTQLLASAAGSNIGQIASTSAKTQSHAGPSSSSSTATSLPSMEALQMQLLLQQAMLSSPLYNPYVALMAGGAMNSATTSAELGAFSSLLGLGGKAGSSTGSGGMVPSLQATASSGAKNRNAASSSSATASAAQKHAQISDPMSNSMLLASMLSLNPMASLLAGGAAEGIDPMLLGSLGDASALWQATSKLSDSMGTPLADQPPTTSKATEAEKSSTSFSQPSKKQTPTSARKGKLNMVVEKLSSNSGSTQK